LFIASAIGYAGGMGVLMSRPILCALDNE
jgi:hypothetical protein